MRWLSSICVLAASWAVGSLAAESDPEMKSVPVCCTLSRRCSRDKAF